MIIIVPLIADELSLRSIAPFHCILLLRVLYPRGKDRFSLVALYRNRVWSQFRRYLSLD